MQKFTKIKSKIIPLKYKDIDTDMIIPASYLKTTTKTGLGKYAFINMKKAYSDFPEETKQIVTDSDAVLFGSVGGPVDKQMEEKWMNCEKNSILGIRKYLNLVVNIRPAKVWSKLAHLSVLKKEKIPNKGLDIITFRELSGGLYFGEHKTFEENGIKKQ